jgi:hypothetical protein
MEATPEVLRRTTLLWSMVFQDNLTRAARDRWPTHGYEPTREAAMAVGHLMVPLLAISTRHFMEGLS